MICKIARVEVLVDLNVDKDHAYWGRRLFEVSGSSLDWTLFLNLEYAINYIRDVIKIRD